MYSFGGRLYLFPFRWDYFVHDFEEWAEFIFMRENGPTKSSLTFVKKIFFWQGGGQFTAIRYDLSCLNPARIHIFTIPSCCLVISIYLFSPLKNDFVSICLCIIIRTTNVVKKSWKKWKSWKNHEKVEKILKFHRNVSLILIPPCSGGDASWQWLLSMLAEEWHISCWVVGRGQVDRAARIYGKCILGKRSCITL